MWLVRLCFIFQRHWLNRLLNLGVYPVLYRAVFRELYMEVHIPMY